MGELFETEQADAADGQASRRPSRRVWIVGAGVLALLVIGGAVALPRLRESHTEASPDHKICPTPEVTHLPDGGTKYVFRFPDQVATEMQPPPDFDPLTASSEDLATYAFPARPTDPVELQQWNNLMKNWRPSTEEHAECELLDYQSSPAGG